MGVCRKKPKNMGGGDLREDGVAESVESGAC